MNNTDNKERYILNKIKQKQNKGIALNNIIDTGILFAISCVILGWLWKYILVKTEIKSNETANEKWLNAYYWLGNYSYKLEIDIQQQDWENKEWSDTLTTRAKSLDKWNEEIQMKIKQNNKGNGNENKHKETVTVFSEVIKTQSEWSQIMKWTNHRYTVDKGCYYATSLNNTTTAFHSNCDNLSPTLVLVETINSIRFGGFTQKTWNGFEDKFDEEAFIFSLSLNKKYSQFQPEAPVFPNSISTKKAVLSFGWDFVVYYEYVTSGFPNVYGDFSDSIYEIIGSSNNENLKKWEIFSWKPMN